jgi:hypothetical protein
VVSVEEFAEVVVPGDFEADPSPGDGGGGPPALLSFVEVAPDFGWFASSGLRK